MARHSYLSLIAAAALVVSATAAEAHTGVGSASGFAHGIIHPFSGLDHILAMVAVGFFAANLGGRALWLVPLSFISMMAVGGVLGFSGIQLPFVEIGIGLSILVMGALVALDARPPVAAAMAIAGFFAIFHGHAHGTEMPVAASGLTYALGFIIATAILHACGLALGLGAMKLAARPKRLAKLAGGLTAAAGAAALGGYL